MHDIHLDPRNRDRYTVPHSEQTMDDQPPPLPPRMAYRPDNPPPHRPAWWVRGMLLLMAATFITVFYVATLVRPYGPNGEPMRMASHESLGLPPCNFKQVAGIPCPSCGMTTSFAMLVRGDVWNSLRANWVGTLLAAALALAVPWSIFCSVRGRYLWITRPEIFTPLALGAYVVVLFVRWAGVLVWGWMDQGQ
jgi:hypothetical protein